MEEKVLKPITEELLKDGQLLTMTFWRDWNELEAYSFLVNRSAPILKVYNNMQSIAPGATVALDKLGEDGHNDQVTSPGDNVYRIDETDDPYWIYHLGQAWRPNNLKIYWENPNGNLIHGWSRDVAIGVGNDEGFTAWSDHTRLSEYMPTTELETLTIPGVTPFIGFENNHPTLTQEPKAFFFGETYQITPINAIDEGEARDIATGKGYRRALKTFGNLETDVPSVPDEWGDSVVVKTVDIVEAMGGR